MMRVVIGDVFDLNLDGPRARVVVEFAAEKKEFERRTHAKGKRKKER